MRSIASLWCARPDDMQPATRRQSVVLKLGRYVVRCLTAQPDIWFLFLYKCGQLVAANLHEPVARSVGILDELFQAQHESQPPPPRDIPAATIGSWPSASQRPNAASGAETSNRDREAGRPASPRPPPPDNDQLRGMEDSDEDTDGTVDSVTGDVYTDSDDDPFVFLAGHRFSVYTTSSSGVSSGRRSSSGGRSINSCRRSTAGTISPIAATTTVTRRRHTCANITADIYTANERGTSLLSTAILGSGRLKKKSMDVIENDNMKLI